MTANLPYGPPVNTDIDYYWTFSGLLCKCCNVSCAIFVRSVRSTSLCRTFPYVLAKSIHKTVALASLMSMLACSRHPETPGTPPVCTYLSMFLFAGMYVVD